MSEYHEFGRPVEQPSNVKELLKDHGVRAEVRERLLQSNRESGGHLSADHARLLSTIQALEAVDPVTPDGKRRMAFRERRADAIEQVQAGQRLADQIREQMSAAARRIRVRAAAQAAAAKRDPLGWGVDFE